MKPSLKLKNRPVNTPYTHQEKYKIRASEVDPNGRAKLQSICELLQEVAGNHALELNFDITRLQEQNLTWILHRLHIQMDRYPGWRERITIKTWPSSGDTIRAFRDFLLFDENKNEIGRALSYWLMFKTDSRRPVRMPKEILDMAPKDTSHVIEVKKERLPALSRPEKSKVFSIRRSDLDMNHHVNNTKYIEWALEAQPGDHSIAELDIEFHAECMYGDTILSELAGREAGGGFSHRIVRERDKKVLAIAQSRFTSV